MTDLMNIACGFIIGYSVTPFINAVFDALRAVIKNSCEEEVKDETK